VRHGTQARSSWEIHSSGDFASPVKGVFGLARHRLRLSADPDARDRPTNADWPVQTSACGRERLSLAAQCVCSGRACRMAIPGQQGRQTDFPCQDPVPGTSLPRTEGAPARDTRKSRRRDSAPVGESRSSPLQQVPVRAFRNRGVRGQADHSVTARSRALTLRVVRNAPDQQRGASRLLRKPPARSSGGACLRRRHHRWAPADATSHCCRSWTPNIPPPSRAARSVDAPFATPGHGNGHARRGAQPPAGGLSHPTHRRPGMRAGRHGSRAVSTDLLHAAPRRRRRS